LAASTARADDARARHAACPSHTVVRARSRRVPLWECPHIVGHQKRRVSMLSWAVVFLVVAIIAGLLGVTGIAGTAANIAWILFVIGIILAIVFFVMGRRGPGL